MSPSQPLLLFNDGSALHILDPITKNFVGSLAGHGGVCPLLQQAGYILTNFPVHNICRRSSEATTLFLYNSEGFHHTNIRSHTTGEAASPQPHMATSEVWTKGGVSETRVRRKFDTFMGVSFHWGRAAAGIHASSPEGNGPGLCTIILAGGRSGGHQAAVMCAVRHDYRSLSRGS